MLMNEIDPIRTNIQEGGDRRPENKILGIAKQSSEIPNELGEGIWVEAIALGNSQCCRFADMRAHIAATSLDCKRHNLTDDWHPNPRHCAKRHSPRVGVLVGK